MGFPLLLTTRLLAVLAKRTYRPSGLMMGIHESPLPPGGEFGALSMEETGWNWPAAARQASKESNAVWRKRKCIVFIKFSCWR
jgi:hypothetical protein